MERIKIGIIDSGIQTDHKAFKNVKNIVTHNIFDGSANANDEELYFRKGGHGTGVFSIIVKHLENRLDDFEFHIVKIFDITGRTSEENMIEAISYCVEHGMNIVNLSLGIETNSPSKKLRDICNKAYNEGTVLIASTSDNPQKTYPAYFPNVFGVVGGVVQSGKDYGILKNNPVEFVGKGNMQRVAALNNKTVFIAGNSHATANITGIIANLKYENREWDAEQIKAHMFKNGRTDIRLFTNRHMQSLNIAEWLGVKVNPCDDNASNNIIDKVFDTKKRLSWMKKIALYPFSNKEMRAFRQFADMCRYEVTEIYDFPKFAAKETSAIINGKEIKINWDIDENSLKDIDTIVLGHPFETAIELNTVFAEKIIDRCIELGKNFYVFDTNLYNELLNRVKNSDCIVYHPDTIQTHNLSLATTIRQGNIKVPNISVVGVSPQSGKFTTQLKIKKLLENTGYNVGWLSTEPQGELFGSDYNFPIGEELSMTMIGNWPSYLHTVLLGIEQYKKPDIIISGHQSSLVRPGKNPFGHDTLKSINFLSSVRPDAVICSVNPAYTEEHLDKIVEIIKVIFDIPILFFSLSRKKIMPKAMDSGMVFLTEEMLSEEEWSSIADRISQKYNKPVVDPHMSKYDLTITESICNFF